MYKPWLQAIIGKLKAKRFRQIFDYLDTAGAGELDLVTLVSALCAHRIDVESPWHCCNTAAAPAVLLCARWYRQVTGKETWGTVCLCRLLHRTRT